MLAAAGPWAAVVSAAIAVVSLYYFVRAQSIARADAEAKERDEERTAAEKTGYDRAMNEMAPKLALATSERDSARADATYWRDRSKS